MDEPEVGGGSEAAPPQPARERILATAVAMFSSVGYDGASMRDIERRAGVTRGLAAYHFGSKDGLWRAVVSWLMDRFHDEMDKYQDLLRVVSEAERGRVLMRVYVHFAANCPEFFRLSLIEGAESSERSRWLAQQHVRRHIDFVHRLAGTGAIRGGPEEAIAYYTLFGAASTAFSVRAQCQELFGVDPADDTFIDALSDRLADLFPLVLTPERGRGSGSPAAAPPLSTANQADADRPRTSR